VAAVGPEGLSGGCERVAVELEQVVGGGDQAPFRADGGSASSVEAIDAAVVFRLAEDGLDHRLALAVELAAVLAGQDPAHERVEAAVPARPGAFAFAGIRWDQHRDALVDDPFHLALVPIAGVRQQHPGRFGDASGAQLALGGVEHRLEVPEVRESRGRAAREA
jgi:hypothetical protein